MEEAVSTDLGEGPSYVRETCIGSFPLTTIKTNERGVIAVQYSTSSEQSNERAGGSFGCGIDKEQGR